MLEKTIDYLEYRYPDVLYCDAYKIMMEELQEAIASSSVAAVTKQIRQMGQSCPAIVKLTDTGEYTFLKCARKVFLDFDECFVSREGHVDGFGGFEPLFSSDGSSLLMVSASHPRYDNHYLIEWILWGVECDECGTPFLDYNNEGLCEQCGASYKLLDYYAKAEEILETEETSSTLFGIELEYENITAKQVGRHLRGHAISKRDGSVRNGVEIVTRPACVETHKKSLLPFYESIKVAAKSNTGMHVHVDKSKLTNYQMGFMMEFLNKDELIPYITTVAGREYSKNTYCRTSKSMTMTWGNSFDEGSYKLYKRSTEKYSPFNTAKSKTVEIRIFSSPESFEEMSAKLDFVAALVKYSSPYAVSVKSLKDKFTWETFTGFVKANRKEFSHFYNYFLKG